MLRGFYTAASGMIAQQRSQEALSNNIANMNTPGYKADQAAKRAFPELLIQQMSSKQIPASNGSNITSKKTIGSLNTGVYVQEMIPNFSQGDIRETSIKTDLAIVPGNVPDEDGALFFTVQNEDGEVRYTRNGNFTVDGQGFLVTGQGYYVLDDAGNPIETDGMEFIVDPDGTLQTADGQTIELGISYTDNVLDMVKEGNDLFNGEAAAVPEGTTFTVKQGFLEGSNVDAMQTMTDMMTAYRLFETNQRVLKAYDESMGKAVNDIGKLG
ncbi:flagellar hook-basal body protein [Oceanobacillus halophilus]|uniref:Flagellar hook-basal body protein n=1 Tax=Oceanobacillus halophilus TaxID=930130 RepID=A0A495A7N3_9BACI|nr:flagellar hook-basal body protein [Oceanobacillus halophilus]RKQ34354.1 flagellar hook-basal body protein [Oceanobacillus halophilus]